MACKCNSNNGILTQRDLSAFIQERGCRPDAPLIPALANGEVLGEGLRVTGVNVRTRGTRSAYRTLDEFGNVEISGYSEDAPEDNTINLEWAKQGCGGKSVAELQECLMDVVIGEFCCGDSRLDSGNAASLLRFRDVSPDGYSYSDLASFDAEDNERVTTSQSATMGDVLRTYDLDLSEINLNEAFSDPGFATTVTVLDAENCTLDASCGKPEYGCGEVWYAVTDNGKIIYKTPDNPVRITAAIPGWGNFALGIVENGNRLYVLDGPSGVLPGVLHIVELSSSLSPEVAGLGSVESIDLPYLYYGMKRCGGSIVAWGRNPSDSSSVISTINLDGSLDHKHIGDEDGLIIADVACCGETYYVVGSAGFIGKLTDCQPLTSFGNSPTNGSITKIAIREAGEIWYTSGANVWWTRDENETVNQSIVVHDFAEDSIIAWSSPCVGYLLGATPSEWQVRTTTDGGATWHNGSRLPSTIRNGAGPGTSFASMAVGLPCCGNKSLQANNMILAAGTYIHQSTIQQC